MIKLELAADNLRQTPLKKLPNSKQSLADIVAQALTQKITTGALKRNEQLPTEAELCAIHRVSRITVRRALDQLQQQGLIERIAGKGTFVASRGALGHWQLDSIEDLFHIIEETRTDKPKILRWELAKPTLEARKFLGVKQGKTYLMEAIRFMDRTPIYVIEGYIPIHIGKLISYDDLQHTTPAELYETRLNLPPQSVVEEVSACRAPANIARLLKVKTGDPIIYHTLQFWGPNGPLQYIRQWWHSDYFKRRYELTRR